MRDNLLEYNKYNILSMMFVYIKINLIVINIYIIQTLRYISCK